MKVSTDMTRRLDGILFGFYSPAEVRQMSTVEIKALSAFDQFGTPLKEGLYDPRMGLSPYERNTRCVTCGQDSEGCPGHLGHLELIVPVYNVFLVSYLHKLLRTKCLFCHKLKASETRTKHFRVMFNLLKFGMPAEFETYKRLCEIRIPSKYRESQLKKSKPTQASKELRKHSESTRRNSETSEGTADGPKEAVVNKELAMQEMITSLDKQAHVERKRIEGLLDIKAHPERFENGIEWNCSISQQFR
jgi:DNA-directed RNA polymerase I subunit RPA1